MALWNVELSGQTSKYFPFSVISAFSFLTSWPRPLKASVWSRRSNNFLQTPVPPQSSSRPFLFCCPLLSFDFQPVVNGSDKDRLEATALRFTFIDFHLVLTGTAQSNEASGVADVISDYFLFAFMLALIVRCLRKAFFFYFYDCSEQRYCPVGRLGCQPPPSSRPPVDDGVANKHIPMLRYFSSFLLPTSVPSYHTLAPRYSLLHSSTSALFELTWLLCADCFLG